MEFIFGSLVTLVTIFLVARLFINNRAIAPLSIMPYTQSYVHQVSGPLQRSPMPSFLSFPNRQSYSWQAENSLRIFVMEDEAYWIKDNQVHVAEISENGDVSESGKVVDMMGMSRVQLDKMMYIVDRLTEGKNNDIGNPRNS